MQLEESSEIQEIRKEEQGPEPELFEERIIEQESNGQVTPAKIRRTGNDANAWQVGYYKRIKL